MEAGLQQDPSTYSDSCFSGVAAALIRWINRVTDSARMHIKHRHKDVIPDECSSAREYDTDVKTASIELLSREALRQGDRIDMLR
jgi:hypothetical protein